MKYKVKSQVAINQITHQIDEIIDVDSDLAEELLKTGCIEPTTIPFSGEIITTDKAPPVHTKLGGAFHALVGAAVEVRTRIHEIDTRLNELNGQRQKVLSQEVSKTDYLEFIRADVARQGKQYADIMLKKFKRPTSAAFSRIDRMHKYNQPLDLLYLSGEVLPYGEVSASAMCFIFGELIVKRMGDILKNMSWPEDNMPVSERNGMLETINVEIEKLSNERDELAGMLTTAGLVR